MSEYRELPEKETYGEEEKIDIVEFLTDVIQGVRKFWWLVIILTLFFSAKSYFHVTRTYVPQYVASATCSVNSVTGSTAADMAAVFPYILTSGVLADVVAEDMGMESIPGSVSVIADEGINLLTISVSAGDPQVAYDTLVSVMENYPEVAKFVVGETKLTILDAMLIL